jgi:HK97 family phage major capsid protein
MIPSFSDLSAMDSGQLRGAIAQLDAALLDLHQSPNGELRHLDHADQQSFDRLSELRSKADQYLAGRTQMERHPAGMQTVGTGESVGYSGYRSRTATNDPPLLSRSQSISDYVRQSRSEGVHAGAHLSFAKIARGLATGNWDGAETEQRAIAESPATSGGHMVPVPVAAQVIDKARNASRVIEAGAKTIPMTSATLKYPRLTADAPASWRSEAGAITDQAMTFDSVTFTARSLAVLVKVSWELFEDVSPESMATVEDSFAKVLGIELDRAALRGSGAPPEPQGIRNQTGVTLTSHGANGTAITNYDWFLDAAGVVLANGFTPNASITAPRTATSLSKLKDTANAYLAPPATLLPILPTSQVPINLTVGTSTDSSEIYTGAWSNCWIGIRTGFTLRFLQERYSDNGQYAFLASLRADVQLAQPSAFVVDLGVRG